MSRNYSRKSDSSKDVKDAFLTYLLELPAEEAEVALSVLDRLETADAWKWESFCKYASPLEFVCGLSEALTSDRSPAAQEMHKMLNEYRPHRLDFAVEIDEVSAGEGEVPKVTGWTTLCDEQGLPYSVLPFSVKPDLQGKSMVRCDWSRRMYLTPDAAELPLTLEGCRKAVDEFLQEKRSTIDAEIARETMRIVNEDPDLLRLWRDPEPYRPLRKFLTNAVEKYAQMRPPNARIVFKTTMEHYLNDQLKKGNAPVDLKKKAQLINHGKIPDIEC